MFNTGDRITNEDLTKFFTSIIKRLNSLTINELQGLTSGQFVNDGYNTKEGDYRADVLNVWSEQYFDSPVVGEVNYLEHYIHRIQTLKGGE